MKEYSCVFSYRVSETCSKGFTACFSANDVEELLLAVLAIQEASDYRFDSIEVFEDDVLVFSLKLTNSSHGSAN